jgi:hypothetical protein
MKFCTITPTRSDRPELLNHCIWQINRFRIKPDAVYLIDYPPDGPGFDLVTRIQTGVEQAQLDGMDWAVIIEDDDAYNRNYLDNFLPFMETTGKNQVDFIGQETSIYYNLKNQTFKEWQHPHRSSLFITAFRISALNNFVWPTDQNPFLDIRLWEYARFRKRQFIKTGAIGMKHGLGLCGGKGHVQKNPNFDTDLKWLRASVDEKSFEFYKNLIPKL